MSFQVFEFHDGKKSSLIKYLTHYSYGYQDQVIGIFFWPSFRVHMQYVR